MSKKVLLLYGGFSSEKDVSISAKNDIAEALKSKNYTVIEHNLTNAWELVEVLKTEKPDVVYNALHGNWGEDGEIQGFLDLLQIPYTHSNLKTSVIGMDKYITKLIATQYGVKTAKGEKLSAAEYAQQGTRINYPHVVKPLCDGSSVGVHIVKNAKEAKNVKYEDPETKLIVEEYIAGQELTVMCLEGKTYAVTELRAKNEFYDFEAKYTKGATEHILPAEIPEDVEKRCKKFAEIMHKTLKCNTLSRSDFRYNFKDGLVFLEINTNPGMTKLSLVPEQAAYAKIEFADICQKLVENAKCRPL